MRPELRVLAIAAVAVASIAIPALLVQRALPPSVEPEVVAAGSGPAHPVPLERHGDVQRLALATPRFPSATHADVQLVVGTYGRPATQTVQLVLRDANGKTFGSCRVPPAAYAGNGLVECPVAQPGRLRRIDVVAHGADPIAVNAVDDDGGRLVAGALVRQHRYSGVGPRVRALGDRIGVTRPVLYSPTILFACLVASFALFGAAWIVAGSRQ
jgi:hypothetical protein